MGPEASSTCSTSSSSENKWDISNHGYQLDKTDKSILTRLFFWFLCMPREEIILFIQLPFHARGYLEFQLWDRAICVRTVFCPM